MILCSFMFSHLFNFATDNLCEFHVICHHFKKLRYLTVMNDNLTIHVKYIYFLRVIYFRKLYLSVNQLNYSYLGYSNYISMKLIPQILEYLVGFFGGGREGGGGGNWVGLGFFLTN